VQPRTASTRSFSAERACHVGDGEVRASFVDGLACGVEYPRDGLFVAGGRRTGPAVGAHSGIRLLAAVGDRESLDPVQPARPRRCGSDTFAMFGNWSAISHVGHERASLRDAFRRSAHFGSGHVTSLPIRFNVQTFSAGLRDAGRVLCILHVHPHPGGLQHQLNLDQTNPTLKPCGLGNGDSPVASQV
jgi:hypothetical protein